MAFALPPIVLDPNVLTALVLATGLLAGYALVKKMGKGGTCGPTCSCGPSCKCGPNCKCGPSCGSCNASQQEMNLKLAYFPLPGRAEPIRVALKLGRINFTDEHLTAEQWKDRKPQTPFGQLPVLYVNNEPLAQSLAIFRYVARRASLYPCCRTWSHFLCAKADEVVFLVDEVYDWLKPTYTMQEDEQVSTRKALTAEGNPIAKIFSHIEDKLAKNAEKGDKYLVANTLTVADVSVFCMSAMLTSGWLRGIDKGFLERFPHVKQHKTMVAQMPQVREHYANLPAEVTAAWNKAGIDVAAYQQ